MKLTLLPLIIIAGTCAASAQTFNLSVEASQTGWVNSSGFGNTDNTNYITGFLDGVEHRSYFTFDLSGVIGEVVSASLSINQADAGFSSVDASEFALFTSIDSSVPSAGTIDDTSLFGELGTGDVFGGTSAISASDSVVDVALNSNFVTAANSSGSSIVIGSRLLTAGSLDDEFIFGFSTGEGATLNLVVDPNGSAVPEPSSVLLLSLAGLGVIARRKR